MATMEEMVKAVQAHAEAHYDEDGWDEIVEAWDARDIGEYLGRMEIDHVDDAVEEMHALAKLRKERGDEIRATAW